MSATRATPNLVLDQQNNREVGTLISFADKVGREAEYVATSKGCSSLSIHFEAALKVFAASLIYKNWLESNASRNDSLYKIVEQSYAKTIYNAIKINNQIGSCLMFRSLPDAERIVSVHSSANGQADNRDELIRQKILNSKVDRPCGLRSFEKDYIGGEPYERLVNKYAVYPYEWKNIGKEIDDTKAVGIILNGPPGTGKTLFAEALAEKLNQGGHKAVFFSLSAADIKGRYVGDSEGAIKILFEEARKETRGGKNPVVILIDEFDALIDNNSSEAGGTGLLGQVNIEMNGAKGVSNKGIIVVAATNFPERIPDSALSRFQKIFASFPGYDNIRKIIISKLKKMGTARYNFKIDYESKDKIREKYIGTLAGELGYSENSAEYNELIENRMDDIDTMVYYLRDLGLAKESEKQSIRDALAGTGLGAEERKAYQQKLDELEKSEYFPLPYAPREIDGVFTYMALTAGVRSVEFVNMMPEKRELLQEWVWDESEYKGDEYDANGRCISKNKIYQKCALYPVGIYDPIRDALPKEKRKYSQEESVVSYNFENEFTPQTWKNAFATLNTETQMELKQKLNEKKKVKKVVTKRIKKQDGAFEFYLQFEWDFKKQQYVPAVLDRKQQPRLLKMMYMLGISQIGFDDFYEAMQNVKPVPVRNARQLIEFNKYSASFSDNGEDIEQLKQIAEYQDKIPKSTPTDDVLDNVQKILRSLAKLTNASGKAADELENKRV